MEKNLNVCQYTLVFAMRYALGRKSMAPSIVIEDVIYNWDKLSDYTKAQIKEEIQEAIDNQRAGMMCDVAEWEKLLRLE